MWSLADLIQPVCLSHTFITSQADSNNDFILTIRVICGQTSWFNSKLILNEASTPFVIIPCYGMTSQKNCFIFSGPSRLPLPEACLPIKPLRLHAHTRFDYSVYEFWNTWLHKNIFRLRYQTEDRRLKAWSH